MRAKEVGEDLQKHEKYWRIQKNWVPIFVSGEDSQQLPSAIEVEPFSLPPPPPPPPKGVFLTHPKTRLIPQESDWVAFRSHSRSNKLFPHLTNKERPPSIRATTTLGPRVVPSPHLQSTKTFFRLTPTSAGPGRGAACSHSPSMDHGRHLLLRGTLPPIEAALCPRRCLLHPSWTL